MAIIEAPDFELHPAGTFRMRVTKVNEDVKRKTKFGEKEGVQIRLESDQLGEDGKPLAVIITVNRAIGPGSNLAKYVKQITGAAPGQRFDPQTLLNRWVMATIAHVDRDERTFANVVHMEPLTAASAAKSLPKSGAVAQTDSGDAPLFDEKQFDLERLTEPASRRANSY